MCAECRVSTGKVSRDKLLMIIINWTTGFFFLVFRLTTMNGDAQLLALAEISTGIKSDVIASERRPSVALVTPIGIGCNGIADAIRMQIHTHQWAGLQRYPNAVWYVDGLNTVYVAL